MTASMLRWPAEESDTRTARFLDEVATVDWQDTLSAWKQSAAILRRIAGDPSFIYRAVRNVMVDPKLRSMAERFGHITQIVLQDALDRGFRLRLHVYGEVQPDWPHNHRWPLTNLLLYGRLVQSIYDWRHTLTEHADVSRITPIQVSERVVGDIYSLHADVVDCVVGTPGSVALLIRGPATRDRFAIFERETNRCWWRYGAGGESAEERRAKAMTDLDLEALLDHLVAVGVASAK